MQSDSVGGDKRDIPVQGPPALGYRDLQSVLVPRLSIEDEETLFHRVISDYNAALSDRTEWEARLAEWEDAYYNRVAEKTFPWEGASNFHVPVTMMGVETYKPRLNEGILGQWPPILVVPTREADDERKDKVETFLNWQLKNEIPNIEELVMQSAHLFLQPGLAVAKTYWKIIRQQRKMVREFPGSTPLDDIFEAIFGTAQPADLEDLGKNRWRGLIATSPAAGPPCECEIEVNVIDNEVTRVIQVLVIREEVTEHPQIDLIDPIDIIGPAKGGQDVPDLPWIIHRLWMDEDDLRRKAASGRFYADAVQEVLDSGPPRGDDPSRDSNLYRQGQDQAEGIQGQGPSNYRRMQWSVLECYRRWDIDGDGLDEEIIVWVTPHAAQRVLGWDYLDNVYAHGRRPIRVAKYFPIPFRFLGLSFAEVVRGIQEELNAIHNQRVDYGTLQNLPFGFKRASSTIPQISQRMRPGEFIDVDNPQQDIFIPHFQGSPAWGAQEEATLMQHFERLSGLTDLSIGRQPNRVGATRTASGTQTLLSESGLRFKGALQAFQRFWVGIFEDILALDQEYLPPQKEFRVTGRLPAVLQIKDRSELRGQYDLSLSANTDTMNRQKQRDDATVVLQSTLNPALMQGGLIGMKGIRRAMEKLYKAFGEDPSFYLEDKAVVRSPEQELMMFMVGQYVGPVQGEDYDYHLQKHQADVANPILTPAVKRMLQRHIGETQQALQTQQMAQQMAQQQQTQQVGAQTPNATAGAAQPQPAGQPPPASPSGGMPSP